MSSNSIAFARRLFLLDGLGAVLSAFMHGVILVSLESIIGMPSNVLFVLAAVACIFAFYSLLCSCRIGENWRPFLKAIAVLNLLFCIASFGLMIYFYQHLTVWGVLYFAGEIIAVTGLAMFEWKSASRDPKSSVG